MTQKDAFIFQGMCHERSFIPRNVWLLGDRNDNVGEGAHAHVYREGMWSSLLGAILSGKFYDESRNRERMEEVTTGIKWGGPKRNHETRLSLSLKCSSAYIGQI